MGNELARYFEERVLGPEDDIARYVEVSADDYFIRIITDDYEGVAQMSVATAEAMLPALAKAIAHVRAQQRKNGEVEQ